MKVVFLIGAAAFALAIAGCDAGPSASKAPPAASVTTASAAQAPADPSPCYAFYY